MKRFFYNLKILFSLLLKQDLGYAISSTVDTLESLEEKSKNSEKAIKVLHEEMTELENKLTLYEKAAKEVNTMMKKSPRLARGARIKK